MAFCHHFWTSHSFLCGCDWRDTCQCKSLYLKKCIFTVVFGDLPLLGSPHHMPHSVSALHSHHRCFMISALFDLSPDLMYFGVFVKIFVFLPGLLKKRGGGFCKDFFFSFSLLLCVFFRKIHVYNFTMFISESIT